MKQSGFIKRFSQVGPKKRKHAPEKKNLRNVTKSTSFLFTVTCSQLRIPTAYAYCVNTPYLLNSYPCIWQIGTYSRLLYSYNRLTMNRIRYFFLRSAYSTCRTYSQAMHSRPHGVGYKYAALNWPLKGILLLLVVCARINRPFILSARLHCPDCCKTIARLLGSIRPPRPSFCMPHTIQYY